MGLSNYPPGFDGVFPWDYDYPCEVCGNMEDNCVCPECLECGDIGMPLCYKKHGLVLSKTQRIVMEYNAYLEIETAMTEEELWQEEMRQEVPWDIEYDG